MSRWDEDCIPAINVSPLEFSFQAPELITSHDNHFTAAVNSYVLRSLDPDTPDQLAEPRLGVLEHPSAWRAI
jgi:hypothetical protein